MSDRYGIGKLEIFGSQTCRTAGQDSDIDLLYTLRRGRLGCEIEQLADELSELFGHRVDLVAIGRILPECHVRRRPRRPSRRPARTWCRTRHHLSR
jgi:predicted nucleotidyltransferase